MARWPISNERLEEYLAALVELNEYFEEQDLIWDCQHGDPYANAICLVCGAAHQTDADCEDGDCLKCKADGTVVSILALRGYIDGSRTGDG